jgi:UDP-N-acetylmuramoyl-L-alanyl-D-glutamate--2,6-diaminopimelate ligase
MIVIGVTGTNGKTSTCYFLAHALEAAGVKSGMTSTALFKIGEKEWTNDKKMTMLGRFQLQRLLRQMVDAGCAYAVIETSSQGVVQYRHRGIAYDGCVFTNLTPEHIEAHGGFENYKQAKIDFFRHAVSLPRKIIAGKTIPRIAILNSDDPHASDFAISGFDRIVTFGVNHLGDVRATGIQESLDGISFILGSTSFSLRTPGHVTVLNALAAITAAETFGVDGDLIASHLKALPGMPGRYERISEGQPFTVIVDYAYEPAALTALLDFVAARKGTGRMIHVTGSAGGGRDVARRSVIGRLSGERCDITIVTNEDPYDDDPQEIIRQIAGGAREAGKIEGSNLFLILDRGEAIKKAISLARPNDVVLITGKGSEPVIAGPRGTKTPFDDRDVARNELMKTVTSHESRV